MGSRKIEMDADQLARENMSNDMSKIITPWSGRVIELSLFETITCISREKNERRGYGRVRGMHEAANPFSVHVSAQARTFSSFCDLKPVIL